MKKGYRLRGYLPQPPTSPLKTFSRHSLKSHFSRLILQNVSLSLDKLNVWRIWLWWRSHSQGTVSRHSFKSAENVTWKLSSEECDLGWTLEHRLQGTLSSLSRIILHIQNVIWKTPQWSVWPRINSGSHSYGNILHIAWLELVGSIKLKVSFTKEPYKRDAIVPKRHVILSILLTVATPLSLLHSLQVTFSTTFLLQSWSEELPP